MYVCMYIYKHFGMVNIKIKIFLFNGGGLDNVAGGWSVSDDVVVT